MQPQRLFESVLIVRISIAVEHALRPEQVIDVMDVAVMVFAEFGEAIVQRVLIIHFRLTEIQPVTCNAHDTEIQTLLLVPKLPGVRIGPID